MMAGATCVRTAVPAALLVVSALVESALCVAAVSETESGNDANLTWQVQSVCSLRCACTHRLSSSAARCEYAM